MPVSALGKGVAPLLMNAACLTANKSKNNWKFEISMPMIYSSRAVEAAFPDIP
jgi:hypothetical protein